MPIWDFRFTKDTMASTVQEFSVDKGLLSTQEDGKSTQEDEKQKWEKTLLGYGIVILEVLALGAGVVCAQSLGGLVPPFELNGWRYTAQFIIVAPIILFKRLSVFPKREDIVWLALTAFCSVLFNVSFYTSANYLPVGTVGGVGPSLMLLICALVTVVFERKCGCIMTIACMACLAGILLVTQPSFLFKDSGTVAYHPPCGPLSNQGLGLGDNISLGHGASQTKNGSFNSSAEWKEEGAHVAVEIGYLCLLASAVAKSTRLFVVNRKLPDLNAFIISFWVSITGIVSQFIVMAIIEEPALPKTPVCILFLLAHAFAAGLGSVLTMFGSQLLLPATVSLLLSLEVVLLFGVQYTIMRSVYPGKENWMEFLGAALVLIGNVLNPAFEIWKRRKQNYKQMS